MPVMALRAAPGMPHMPRGVPTAAEYVLLAGATFVVGVGVARGFAAPLLGLSVCAVIALWWMRGDREGARILEAGTASAATAVFSSFFSSWLGLAGGFPAGALLRDLAFVLFLAAIARHPRQARPHIIVQGALWIGIAGVAVLSLGMIDSAALVGLRGYVLYPAILVLSPAILPRPVVERLARRLLALLGILAVIGLLEAISGGGALDLVGFNRDFTARPAAEASLYTFAGFRRATGGLDYAAFPLMLLLGLVVLLWRPAVVRHRFPLAALFITAIGLSWTRQAWYLLAVVFLLVLLFPPVQAERRLRGPAVGVVAALAVGLALLSMVGPGGTVTERFLGSDRSSSQSTELRLQRAQNALELQGNELLGLGPGTTGRAAERRQLDPDSPGRVVIDNGYLVWLVEVGLIGTALILSLVIAWIWNVCREGSLAAAGALALLGTANMVYAVTEAPELLAIAAVVIAILRATAPRREPLGVHSGPRLISGRYA